MYIQGLVSGSSLIGDKFEFNGKEYTLKRDVSFGEYKKITQLQLDMKNATIDNENELSVRFNNSMTEFLTSLLGITEEELDSLGLISSAELFGKSFQVATDIKKKLKTTSD
ncbi:hypothetical protein [Nitrososphaeria virus YSH_922147]|uniref:Uncharacterized protein n=1 Tax=Nitrososphaeria virus YSH_922147 TaxID=3071323 RepID=A0A976UAS0_9CAUD|nr:hypothetical protein QKV94_gp37 [Yangshan Harbor Nitrososphaeria virus]UVF62446.1 hypothetical protein [Nitrososphaeria virus YSH_922147]